MHESVDLQLGLVEDVRGGLLDVVVDYITDARIEAHLEWKWRRFRLEVLVEWEGEKGFSLLPS